jgi:hypothetical protein
LQLRENLKILQAFFKQAFDRIAPPIDQDPAKFAHAHH